VQRAFAPTPNKLSLLVYVHEVDKTELWHNRRGRLNRRAIVNMTNQ
jgi:hypothetical protein